MFGWLAEQAEIARRAAEEAARQAAEEARRIAEEVARRAAEEAARFEAARVAAEEEARRVAEEFFGRSDVGFTSQTAPQGAFGFLQVHIVGPAINAVVHAKTYAEAATASVTGVANSVFGAIADGVRSLVNEVTDGWWPIFSEPLKWAVAQAIDMANTAKDAIVDWAMDTGLSLLSAPVEFTHYAIVDHVVPWIVDHVANPILNLLEPIRDIINPHLGNIRPDLFIPEPVDLDRMFAPVVDEDQLVKHERVDFEDWTHDELILIADLGAAAQVGFADLSLLNAVADRTGQSLYDENGNVNDEFVYENVDWDESLKDWSRERFDILEIKEATFATLDALSSFNVPYQANVALMEHKVTGEFFISIGGTDRDDGIEDILADVWLASVGTTGGAVEAIEGIIQGFFDGPFISDGAYVNLTGGSLGGGEALQQYRENPEWFDHVYPIISVGYGGVLGTYYDRNVWSVNEMGDPNITEINGDDEGSDFNDLVTGTGHVGAGKTYWIPDVVQNPNLPDDALDNSEFWDVHSPSNLWYSITGGNKPTVDPDGETQTDFLETGTVTLNHKKTTVTLQNTFENPLAIAFVATKHGNQAVNVRISEVEGNELTLSLDEPNYLDGRHAKETVNFLVVEEGSWVLEDGTVIEARTLASNKLTSKGFEGVEFTAEFDETPLIFSQVQTFNGGDFVTTRQKSADENGFEISMQEEEANNNGGHVTETLGWFAIEAGAGSSGDFNWVAGQFSSANHLESNVILGSDGLETFNAVVSLSSFDGADTAWVRGHGQLEDGFVISVEEEKSRDNETWHIDETVDYFAFDGSGVLSATALDDLNIV